MNVGGDIIEITFTHETLGAGVIFPVSNSDSSIDLGGYRSNDDQNMVTGAGEMIDQLTNKRWSVECPVAWDSNTREDLEKINALAASPIPADWTISMINGTIYSGQGKPVGDYTGNANTAQFPLKIAGGGKLKKQ